MPTASIRLGVLFLGLALLGLLARYPRRTGAGALLALLDGLVFAVLGLGVVWAFGAIVLDYPWWEESLASQILGVILGGESKEARRLLGPLTAWFLASGIAAGLWGIRNRARLKAKLLNLFVSDERGGVAGLVSGYTDRLDEPLVTFEVQYVRKAGEWHGGAGRSEKRPLPALTQWESQGHFVAQNQPRMQGRADPSVLEVTCKFSEGDRVPHHATTLTQLTHPGHAYLGQVETTNLARGTKLDVDVRIQWMDQRLDEWVPILSRYPVERVPFATAPEVLRGGVFADVDVPVMSPDQVVAAYIDSVREAGPAKWLVSLPAKEGARVHLLGTGFDSTLIKVALPAQTVRDLARDARTMT